jgi:acyl-CoA reductase-like NAD-dependent aldehyde dehydrogenase
MQKLILIIGLLVATNILFAQGKREQMREKVEVKIEEYKDRLDLSDDQVADLKAMRESMKPELEAIRKDESMKRSEKMRAHADIIEKQEEEMAKILNDDQLTELEIIKKEVRENVKKRKDRRRDRRGDGR